MVTLHTEKFYEELNTRNFSTIEELKQSVIDFLSKRFYDEGYFYEEEERREQCLTVATDLTDAIYEDVYTELLANFYFQKCDYEISGFMSEKILCERCEYGKKEPALKKIYCELIDKVFSIETVFNMDMLDDIIEKALSTPEDGLSSYTSRYPLGENYNMDNPNKPENFKKAKNFEESMKRNFKLLMKHVCPILYRHIYPVFLLIMLDSNHSKKYKDEDFWELFLSPIYNHSDLEKYIFSLLSQKRQAKEKTQDTIFTVAKNKLIRHFQDKKDVFDKYESEEIERRKQLIEFWEKMGAETYCSMHPGITRETTDYETITPTPLNLRPNLLMQKMECISFISKPTNKSLSELYQTEIAEAKKELEYT